MTSVKQGSFGKRWLQRGGVAAVAVVCGSTLIACGSSKSTTSSSAAKNTPGPSANKLSLAIGSDPETLDADQTRAGTDLYYTYNVFEQLLRRAPDGTLQPGIATKWDVAPDGKTITFTLRDNAKFQNGDPVTADDVKFSFQRYADKALGNVFASNLSDVAGVDVVSPTQVAVRLTQPDGSFLNAAGYAWIVPKNYITQHGNDYFAQHPIGTGPYMFDSRSIKQSFVLKRFDGYWGQKPYYAELDFQIIPDDNARISALRSGQVQFAAQVPPQMTSQIQSAGNLKVVTGFTGDNIFLDLNMKAQGMPWDKPEVRQALSYAIDRNAIIKNVLGGQGLPLVGLAPNDNGYTGTDLKEKAYDPAKAKQLLAQAGYPNGFSMDFWAPVNGRLPASEQVAQAIVGFWNDIGVKATPKLVSYSEWVNAEKGSSTINGAVFGLWGDSAFDPQQRLVGSMTCTGPYSHTCDPTLDADISKVKTTVDATQRQQAIHDTFAYALEQQDVINIYSAEGAFGMQKNIQWQPWKGVAYTIMQNAYQS